MPIDSSLSPGGLPAFPFYGGPVVKLDTTARATSDQLWSDLVGELATLQAATCDGELADRVFGSTFEELYG